MTSALVDAMRAARVLFLLVLFLCGIAAPVSGAEKATTITADHLQYIAESRKYLASGAARVEKDDAVITSDEMTYDENTTDVTASGDVHYEDTQVSIRAARAEMKMEDKTGTLYDAVVFFKKNHTYIKGAEIEKRQGEEYYTPDASFTTCDAPLPAWCFRGKQVHAEVGERLTARDATFSIEGLPVLYTPYLWSPLITERQTGFLLPVVGYSKSRGAEFTLPFYWNIAENRDATLLLEEYSKRGLGTGVEYRFMEPSGRYGHLWVYHIYDTELEKDYVEAKGLYEARRTDGLGGFLNLNYVNEQDFYREYSLGRDIRIQRFVESTGEVNLPLHDGRLYLLSQYWVDLQNPQGQVPQRLPEAGYVLNYVQVGGVNVSALAKASNIWREDGLSAERLDIYPRVLYSFGSDVVVSQTAAVRGTGYAYYKNSGTEDDNVFRSSFEYDADVHTRFYKKYESFTHIVEPSVSFHYVTSTKNDLPVFDATELYGKTSLVGLSLLNRGMAGGGDVFMTRLAQFLDANGGNRPFLPLLLDVSVKKPLPVMLEATYDYYSNRIETLFYTVGAKVFNIDLLVGERYSKKDDARTYFATASFSPLESLRVAGQMWYDAKGQGLTDLTLNVRYQRQCWGVRVEAVKRPGDFTMRVLFDIAGINSKVAAKQSPADSKTYF